MNAPDRQAWLQARRAGLGGSDIAAILGLSPYRTPMSVWLEKTGRQEPTFDPAAEERMFWGSAMEDLVARRYAHLKGARIQRVNTPLVHAGGILRGNIDRAVVPEGRQARWIEAERRLRGADRILEVKTAGAFAERSADWGEPGTDQVPIHYWTQVQTYQGLAQVQEADLAVLFGGQRLAIYTITADAGIFAGIVEQCEEWWRSHVIADVPPQPQSEDEARMLWRAHRPGSVKIVGSDVAEACAELGRIKAQISALEESEQALRDTITCAFGDAEVIAHMGHKLATWRANKAVRKTDWKAVAADLDPGPDLIESFTTETPGARVLRLAITKESV